MPITPFDKITSREIYGADISAIQDLLNKIETILNMLTDTEEDHAMIAVTDQSNPALHYRIYEGTIRNWLETPAPVIYRDTIEVSPAEYTLYAAQGAIVFTVQQSIDNVITADFTYIKAESQNITDFLAHPALTTGIHGVGASTIESILGSQAKVNTHAALGNGAHPVATTGAHGFMSSTDKGIIDAVDFFRYRISGLYYSHNITACTTGTLATVAGKVDVVPFVVPLTQSFDRIAINVTTLSAGMCRLGIYGSLATYKPGALIIDAGEVNTGSTGVKEITINQTLTPGLYWLAKFTQATPTIGAFQNYSLFFVGMDATLAGSAGSGYRLTQAYGALPNPFGTPDGLLFGQQGAVFLRKA